MEGGRRRPKEGQNEGVAGGEGGTVNSLQGLNKTHACYSSTLAANEFSSTVAVVMCLYVAKGGGGNEVAG